MRKQTVSRLTPLFLLSVLLLLAVPSRQAPARQTGAGTKISLAPSAQAGAAAQARLNTAYGQLPLSFEANQGQADSRVQFLSRGKGYSLFLTSTEAVLRLGKADNRLPSKEQAPEPLDSLPQPPFSAFLLPHSTFRIPQSAFRTPHSAFRTTSSAVLRMKLVGANPQPKVAGLEELPGKVNYFLGKDTKWSVS
jgi:hypothetical protein